MGSHKTKSLACFLLLAITSVLVGSAKGDSSKDKEECTEQLAGLATCLPFVGGEAKSPTPDCCSGLKQVLKNKKKCLCVIIKDRNDPDLGSLQINVTRALSLPTVCNAPANVSKCPELLHLDPKSSEAQIFYQFGDSSKAGTSPAPSPSAGVGASPASGNKNARGASSHATSATHRVYASCQLFGLHIFVGGLLLLWLFTH